MSRRTWIVAGVMTLAIAGAIAWAGLDAERTEHAEAAAEAAETDVLPGQVLGEHAAGEHREPEPPAPPGPSVADDPERVRVAIEGARAIADEEVTRRLAALDEEPRDEEWAADAEQALRAWGEAQASEGEGRVTDVRCHTRSCVVTLVWPTFASAQAEAHAVVGGDYGTGCERELRTPMPQDPRLPYAGLVLLTCARE